MSINVLVIFRVMVNVAAKKSEKVKKTKLRHLKKNETGNRLDDDDDDIKILT